MDEQQVEGFEPVGESDAPGPAFGEFVLEFYRTLPRPPILAAPVDWIDPYRDP